MRAIKAARWMQGKPVRRAEAPSRRLRQLEDELRFVLITSAAADTGAVSGRPDRRGRDRTAGLRLQVGASADEVRERWHRRPEVGQLADHPTLCEVAAENIFGEGEQRRFA